MRSQTVRFASGTTTLAGELVLPSGGGPHPGVTLLHGAGRGERDEYRVFAERFAESGIASLIFDRRGHGASGGPHSMDLFALGEDGGAAYRFMAEQPEIDRARCGYGGYSNGSWVASLAARDTPDVAFLVLTGAAGVTPARAEVFRRTEDVRAHGAAHATVAAVERTWALVFDYLATGARPGSMEEELANAARIIRADPAVDSMPIPDFVRQNPVLDSVPRFDRPPLNGDLAPLAATMRDMAYDPIPTLASLTCPVLIVQAALDANIAPAESLRRFQALAGSRPHWRIDVLPGATHEFAGSGLGGYVAGYLDLMAEWIAGVTTGEPAEQTSPNIC